MNMLTRLLTAIILGLALAVVALPAVADGSDTMRVGDMTYGNALDPTGWMPLLWPRDPQGMSYLHQGMKRTPSGTLFNYPPARDDELPDDDSDRWVGYGILQLGFLATDGDSDALFVRQYADWTDGLVLGLLALQYYQPSTARFVEIRASHISSDDQYVRLRAGRYGKYRVQAFYRNMPHTISTNSFPFWDGVGTPNLTVPAPLTPGDSALPDPVAAVAENRPRQTIKLVRTRSGLSLEGQLLKDWFAYASIVNEDRQGTRLWGGTMFFNYPFPHNGGAFETVRPIDFRTTDIHMGLRFVGEAWRFNAVYTGSFFRNHRDYLRYESPFDLWNVVGTPNVGNIYQGEFSLEPDNDYHNLRLELGRDLPMNGDLSMAVAVGTMRQDDALRAPVTCTGMGGVFIAPPADFTFNCADWNTPAALSQTHADVGIDTALLYAKASFRPSTKFGWHAKLRWYKEDYDAHYLLFNPLTGQYGYISENGAQGTVVPGETGIFDPDNPLFWSYAAARIRNIPFGKKKGEFELGADWRITADNTLDAKLSFQRYKPENREVSKLDETRLTLAWVARDLAGGTLRVSLERASRNGDTYHYDPYEEFFAVSLPEFVVPDVGLTALTTDAMRKYDMSDRKQTKWRAIYIFPIGDSATLSATWHGRNDNHDVLIGRQANHNQGITLSWDFQPSPATSISAWGGWDRTRVAMANVNDDGAALGTIGQTDPSLGGPLYPLANRWWLEDKARGINAGATFGHAFDNGMHFDAAWSYVFTRSAVSWVAASPGAFSETQLPWATQGLQGFPDNHYRLNTVDLGLSVPFNNRVGMRLFGRYWSGSFRDWHYLGLDQSLVVDHRIYTDRGPQRDFDAGMLGVMLNIKF